MPPKDPELCMRDVERDSSTITLGKKDFRLGRGNAERRLEGAKVELARSPLCSENQRRIAGPTIREVDNLRHSTMRSNTERLHSKWLRLEDFVAKRTSRDVSKLVLPRLSWRSL